MSDLADLMSRRVSRRSVLRLVAASPLLTACVGAPWSRPAGGDRAVSFSALRQLLEGRAAQDSFSGVVMVARGDHAEFAGAYGMANRDLRLPNDVDTVFPVGSTSKGFTAVAVAQLVQQGRLSFQDRLGKHLDGFPPQVADQVTIHQLLTHTSGMGDVLADPRTAAEQAGWTSPSGELEGLLAIVRQEPLLFTPGSQFSYSNSGYITLGGVVQQVSGESYYDYVPRHVFKPAGMSSSDYVARPRAISDRRDARPYEAPAAGGPRQDVSGMLKLVGTPAGDAYTTLGDMVSYSQALRGHRLLNPALTGTVMSGKVPPRVTAPWHQRDSYAYGMLDGTVNGQRVVWHNGGAPGIGSHFAMFPAAGWTVIVLSNYGPMPVAPAAREAEELVTA
jgi:CubicO group peptidase (beta-lactamase class C family)